jgi:hypothetical protein
MARGMIMPVLASIAPVRLTPADTRPRAVEIGAPRRTARLHWANSPFVFVCFSSRFDRQPPFGLCSTNPRPWTSRPGPLVFAFRGVGAALAARPLLTDDQLHQGL